MSRDRWAVTTVGDVMTAETALTTIRSNESLLDVVQTLEAQKLSVLAVIRDNGQLMGLLEKQAIVRLMQGQTSAINPVPAK